MCSHLCAASHVPLSLWLCSFLCLGGEGSPGGRLLALLRGPDSREGSREASRRAAEPLAALRHEGEHSPFPTVGWRAPPVSGLGRRRCAAAAALPRQQPALSTLLSSPVKRLLETSSREKVLRASFLGSWEVVRSV